MDNYRKWNCIGLKFARIDSRDLIQGEEVRWLVTFKKKYKRELLKKKKEAQAKSLRTYFECNYCHQEKAYICAQHNTTSVLVVTNQTPRYRIDIRCENCGKKWTMGREP